MRSEGERKKEAYAFGQVDKPGSDRHRNSMDAIKLDCGGC